jgi:hypothetical protein
MLKVEKLGGFAGFGGDNLKSRGQCDPKGLSPDHRDAVEKLFSRGSQTAIGPGADMFTYRITRQRDGRQESVEVPEALVPEPLRACVHDVLE